MTGRSQASQNSIALLSERERDLTLDWVSMLTRRSCALRAPNTFLLLEGAWSGALSSESMQALVTIQRSPGRCSPAMSKEQWDVWSKGREWGRVTRVISTQNLKNLAVTPEHCSFKLCYKMVSNDITLPDLITEPSAHLFT